MRSGSAQTLTPLASKKMRMLGLGRAGLLQAGGAAEEVFGASTW